MMSRAAETTCAIMKNNDINRFLKGGAAFDSY